VRVTFANIMCAPDGCKCSIELHASRLKVLVLVREVCSLQFKGQSHYTMSRWATLSCLFCVVTLNSPSSWALGLTWNYLMHKVGALSVIFSNAMQELLNLECHWIKVLWKLGVCSHCALGKPSMSAPRWFCNFQPYGAAILDFFLSFFLFMHNSSRPNQTSSW
jgi:hypothetical protein